MGEKDGQPRSAMSWLAWTEDQKVNLIKRKAETLILFSAFLLSY